MAPSTCGKCNSAVEEGFIADIPVYYGLGFLGVKTKVKWVPGKVQENALGGVKIPRSGLKLVKTYRCTVCGYLENYA